MADRIARDYDLDWDDIVAQTSDGATVGRPHIADALVARGLVRDRAEAFSSILSPRGDYYVALYAPDPVTAVELVVGAGGVPIIAHPARAGRACCRCRCWSGCWTPASPGSSSVTARTSRPASAPCAASARERDLIVTGSSDYHGLGKPNQPGENTTTDEMVARIIEPATGSAPVYP